MKQIIEKIKRSGLVEFIYICCQIIFQKTLSLLRIFVLRLRGYDIKYSVFIGQQSSFFQGKKGAIRIDDKAYIENGVRIRAGFNGSISIGEQVRIHDYCFIYAHDHLVIGENTMISPQVFITDFNHKFSSSKYSRKLKSLGGYESKRVTIGNNVWIGAQSVILPGVTIGDDVIIGAGSVVTKSIAPKSLAVGNPARVIKKIK